LIFISSLIFSNSRRSSDENLVWTYFYKLYKILPSERKSKCVEIFTRKEPSPTFLPLKIAERLQNIRSICMEYLVDAIERRKMIDEDLHTFLATLFIEEILECQDLEKRDEIRQQFRQFMIHTNYLKVQLLIGKLQNTSLRFELAILHGKVKTMH